MLLKKFVSGALITGMLISPYGLPVNDLHRISTVSGATAMLAPAMGQADSQIENQYLPHLTDFLKDMFKDAAGDSKANPENILHYLGLSLDSVEVVPGPTAARDIEFLEQHAANLSKTKENTPEVLRSKAVLAQFVVGALGAIGAYGSRASGNPGMKIKADEDAFANFIHALRYVASTLGVQFVTMTAEGADDGSLSLRPGQGVGDPKAPKLFLIVDPVEITNGMVEARINEKARSNVAVAVIYIPEEKESYISYPPDKKHAYMRYVAYGRSVSIGAARGGYKLDIRDDGKNTLSKILYSLNNLTALEREEMLADRKISDEDRKRLIEDMKDFEPKDVIISGLWRERMRSILCELIEEGIDVGPSAYVDADGRTYDLMDLAAKKKANPEDKDIAALFYNAFDAFVARLNKEVTVSGVSYGNLRFCDAGEAPLFFGTLSDTTDLILGMGGPAERFWAAVGHSVTQLGDGVEMQMETRFVNKDATNNMKVFIQRIIENILPLAFDLEDDNRAAISGPQIALALRKDPFETDKTDIIPSERQLKALTALVNKYREMPESAETDKVIFKHEVLKILLEDFSELELSKGNIEKLSTVDYLWRFGEFANEPATSRVLLPVTIDELMNYYQGIILQAYISGSSANAGDEAGGAPVEVDLDHNNIRVMASAMMPGVHTPLRLKLKFTQQPPANPVDQAKIFIREGHFEEAEAYVRKNFTPEIASEIGYIGNIQDLRELYLVLIDLSRTLLTSTSIDVNASLAEKYEFLILTAVRLRFNLKDFRDMDDLLLDLLFTSDKTVRPAVDHIGFVIRHAILELKGIYDIDVAKKINAIPHSKHKLAEVTSMEFIKDVDEKNPRIIPDIRIHQAVRLCCTLYSLNKLRESIRTAA